ncbi:MAG TPA: chorismate lyase [Steroidobacteraceae bacterium]|nr:chorismate lyase [Steroidobacteraceae bacterium]
MKNSTASIAVPLTPDLWTAGPTALRGLSAEMRSWLTDGGLLTDRIAAMSGGPAGLTLIGQRRGCLLREQQALLEAPGVGCFVREVVLTARGRPWIFAQSLVPDHTLELHPWLAELGDRPLGATLAASADRERGRFEYAWLPAAHSLAARALGWLSCAAPGVWARRSWFALHGRRLLVQEMFLPELMPC